MQSSSKIITDKPNTPFFYRPGALPVDQPTVSKPKQNSKQKYKDGDQPRRLLASASDNAPVAPGSSSAARPRTRSYSHHNFSVEQCCCSLPAPTATTRITLSRAHTSADNHNHNHTKKHY